MSEDRVANLRRHSRWLARLTLVLLTATALLLVVPVARGLLSGGPAPLTATSRLALALVYGGPSLFYLFALWTIARAFSAFAAGGTFGPALARGCTRAGVALALGGAASAVGVPNLLHLFASSGLIPASPHAYRSILIFDSAYLAVGVVGIALVLLGRLIERASEIEREAGALRVELGEFF